MNLLLGALTVGLVLAPLALGIFISYRVHRTLDLTTDGSFGVGAAAVAALLVRGAPPLAAVVLSAFAGVGAGIVTAVLYRRLRVSPLLAGVLTTTAIYSVNLFVMGGGNLSLASVESLVTLGERLGQQAGIPPAITLFGTEVSGTSLSGLLLMGAVAGGLAAGLSLFMGSELGLTMRAAGQNPPMARAVGIEVDRMAILGYGLSNGLTALSGSLFAQFQGFASIQMGIGAIVTGVATLMLGETILGRRPLWRWIAGGVAGAVVYQLVVAGAIRAGLHPNALKLVTATFVLAVLVFPNLTRRNGVRRSVLEEPGHA